MIAKFKSSLFLFTVTVLLAVSPAVSHSLEVQAVTIPSADITLSFVVSGKVTDILVKEGDTVEKGGLLAALHNGPERIQTEQLKVQASDMTRILSAKAELAQKMVDLEKFAAARKKGAVSDWEVAHMELSVRMAKLALQAATLEREQFQRQYAQAVQQLERMRIVSPIPGRVEKLFVEAAEGVEKLGPVVQLVRTDPLWIDAPVPLPQVKQLAVGQRAVVLFPGNPTGKSTDGRIVYISSVADAASDTLRVRIEVGNPSDRPAGERVTVGFPHIRNGKVADTPTN
jgi:HlyD family secretion protein